MEFENSKNINQNYANLNLYPTVEIQTNEKTQQNQNFNNNLFNNSSLIEFIKIFSLLKSKKLDFNSILSSSIGKNMQGFENISEVLSLFKEKEATKEAETLPKIDSLERINWKMKVYKV